MTRVLVIGSGAREHAIAHELCNSGASVSCLASPLMEKVASLIRHFLSIK